MWDCRSDGFGRCMQLMDTKQISRGADFCGATMLMNLLLPNDEWERDQVLRELSKQNVMLCKVMYSDARTSARCKTDGADRLITWKIRDGKWMERDRDRSRHRSESSSRKFPRIYDRAIPVFIFCLFLAKTLALLVHWCQFLYVWTTNSECNRARFAVRSASRRNAATASKPLNAAAIGDENHWSKSKWRCSFHHYDNENVIRILRMASRRWRGMRGMRFARLAGRNKTWSDGIKTHSGLVGRTDRNLMLDWWRASDIASNKLLAY